MKKLLKKIEKEIENAVLNKTIELNHELFRCYLELERANNNN